MNLRQLVDGAIQVAHIAGNVLPGVEGGAKVAETALKLLDELKEVSPTADATSDLEVAHTQLLQKMQTKGSALSGRLRGV